VRAVVLCFPNNPTGAVMTLAEARALAAALEAELDAEEARGGGFVVLLDEVYLGIEGSAHVSLLQVASPRLARQACLVLSASKGLGAMPGARAAWVTAGDPALIGEMVKVQSAASGNASTISQAGLEAALTHCLREPQALSDVSEYYLQRATLMATRLNQLGLAHGLGALCTIPRSTFYVWADFSRLDSVQTDLEIFERLLDLGVAVVPGSAFSMEPEARLLRFSCAQDDLDDLERAVSVIDRALCQLRAAQ
jgi:aspartate/methionine/tyrosine aminotransferase